MPLTLPIRPTPDVRGMIAATIASRGIDPAECDIDAIMALAFVTDPETGTLVPSVGLKLFDLTVEISRRSAHFTLAPDQPDAPPVVPSDVLTVTPPRRRGNRRADSPVARLRGR